MSVVSPLPFRQAVFQEYEARHPGFSCLAFEDVAVLAPLLRNELRRLTASGKDE
ncbi:hypothetical protein [Deinococcus yavapaiensis]|uniref:hypothetical protein n=1 Tax=Deinococcus yavapaiensis TaxID=309889 RepID=UPI00147418D5|nr:hypothetical protein [Deinococcus yavapaiensis]